MLSNLLNQKLQEVQSEIHPKVTPIPQSSGVNPTTIPTDKQLSFYDSLVRGRNLSDEQRECLMKARHVFTRAQMTQIIAWLVGLPWTPRTPSPAPVAPKSPVREGRYAVEYAVDDFRFYEVRQPKEGKWAGYTFLSQLSGENHIPLRDPREREKIFSLIMKDMTGALRRYGQMIGRCGHCRKTLTDAVSREFGIGPVCREKLGV